MARYIDADALYGRVKAATNPYGKPSIEYESGVKVLDMIDQQLTADVVPKSQVEKLQEAYNNRLAKDIQTNADFVRYAQAEVAREIFDGLEKLFYNVMGIDGLQAVRFNPADYADFKKKYTEDEQ